MNYKFIYIKNPNSVILNSELFQSKFNQPQLLKLLYPTNLIVSLLVLLKTEIIRLKGTLNAAVSHLLRTLFPTTYIKRMIITAVF